MSVVRGWFEIVLVGKPFRLDSPPTSTNSFEFRFRFLLTKKPISATKEKEMMKKKRCYRKTITKDFKPKVAENYCAEKLIQIPIYKLKASC